MIRNDNGQTLACCLDSVLGVWGVDGVELTSGFLALNLGTRIFGVAPEQSSPGFFQIYSRNTCGLYLDYANDSDPSIRS